MNKVEVVLKNDEGLHARPASVFVKEAARYKSEIKVIKDNKEYNAKSIIYILSMSASKGDTLTITANGDDEREALEALRALIESNFVK